MLLGEMSRSRRALEELGTRVEEVERRVEELEGVVRKREEREREERKQVQEEEKEERGRREEGGIGQTMLRNMKMLTLAWSISSIPAFMSSSPPSTSSRSTSGDSTGADTDSDTDTIRNGNKNSNEHRNRHTTSNRVTRHQFEQLYDSLPRYVLLVGIGACAFVLRGLVRRVWALGVGGVARRGVRR